MTAKRPPRKYTDDAGTELSETYLEWARETALDWCAGRGDDPAMYFPEDYDKFVPEEGCWIRVVEVPAVALDFDLPVLSMWRAKPFQLGQLKVGKYTLPFRRSQAMIQTPGGTLHLWPHEYVLVDDITFFLGMEPEVVMRTMGGDPVLSSKVEEEFYLASRGIAPRERALMLLNDVESQDFVYFELHPEVAAMFEGVGQPLWRHIALHPRENARA